MNIIDIIILAIIGLSTLSGYSRGFILSFFGFLRVVLSIIIARLTYPYALNFLTKNTNIYNSVKDFIYPKIIDLTSGQSLLSADLISDLIIKLFVILIIYVLINMILAIIIRSINNLFKRPILNSLNKFSGLVFGLVKGVLLVFLIYALLTPVIVLNDQSFIAKNTMDSALGMYFYRPEFLLDFLKNNYLNLMKLI